MITPDELRAIPGLDDLSPDALDFVAGAVEDVRLQPGEYFTHEGDERALFVVVDGEVEITKVVEGDELVIGTRTRGQRFGEVPLTVATAFPASGRAVGSARVLKLDARSWAALRPLAPALADRVATTAHGYLTDLQAWAAQHHAAGVRLVGRRLDPRVHRLTGFLTRNQVDFEHADAADGETDGAPVLEVDGLRLVDPGLREVGRVVGLTVTPSATDYDVVILGAGPAGLTAAVNAAAEGLRTVVVEALAPGGQAGTSTRIENYTGFPFGISGDELASRALAQARRLGAEIVVTRRVEALDARRREVVLDGGDRLRAAAVIVATGVDWRTLGLDGEERYLGHGVYYGAARSDATLARGAHVCIVGAGNSAGQAALFFSRHAATVTMVVRGPSLAASMSTYLIDQIAATDQIRVLLGTEVVALHGEPDLEAVDLRRRDTGATTTADCAVVFVMIGADAGTSWLGGDVARDPRGFVLTGPDAEASGRWPATRHPFGLETSVPGVFAVGDVRSGSVKRVVAGVGEGGTAVAYTHQYLALHEGAGEP